MVFMTSAIRSSAVPASGRTKSKTTLIKLAAAALLASGGFASAQDVRSALHQTDAEAPATAAVTQAIDHTQAIGGQADSERLSTAQQAAQQIHLGFSAPPVMPAGLTTPARMMMSRDLRGDRQQVTISLKVLKVDEPTREAIYGLLSPNDVSMTFQEPVDFAAALSGLPIEGQSTATTVQAPSRVATCGISPELIAKIHKIVHDSDASSISTSPGVIALDGQIVEIQDRHQRPFAIDGYIFKSEQNEGTFTPNVHVFTTGTSIQMTATITESDDIDLATRIISQSVSAGKDELVYGVAKKPFRVQTPTQVTRTSTARFSAAPGRTFLIDPYQTQTVAITKETGVLFKNKSRSNTELNVMYLLQPSINP